MADSNQAKEVKVNAQLGGKKIHPTKVTLECSINGMAQASVSYIHTGEDADRSASDITSKDIFKAMGARQTKSFNISESDTNISISSDVGGSLQFSGSTSAPEYGFSTSDLELTEVVQPEYAFINSFDLSCYTSLISMDYDLEEEELPDNLAECIKMCIENIMTVAEDNMQNLEGLAKESVQRHHEINQKVKKYVMELLDASTDTMGWEEELQELKETNGGNTIKTRINSILLNRSNGFFNTLLQLAEEFQCVYVPEFDKVGALVNKKKIFENRQQATINIASLTARCGSMGMFPIRGVAVVGLSAGEDIDELTAGNSFIAYPDDIAPGGSILQVQGPAWVPEDMYVDEELPEIPNSSAGRKEAQTKGYSSSSKAEEIKKQISKKSEKRKSILKTWAETEYYWQALGQSFVLISSELDMKLQVGKCYNVSGKKGKIFSGILTNITHSVESSYEQADATTTYEFTHVIMGDANIPGIK